MIWDKTTYTIWTFERNIFRSEFALRNPSRESHRMIIPKNRVWEGQKKVHQSAIAYRFYYGILFSRTTISCNLDFKIKKIKLEEKSSIWKSGNVYWKINNQNEKIYLFIVVCSFARDDWSWIPLTCIFRQHTTFYFILSEPAYNRKMQK